MARMRYLAGFAHLQLLPLVRVVPVHANGPHEGGQLERRLQFQQGDVLGIITP